MPRFIVLRHEPGSAGGRPLHWDLMLEFDDALRTWALAAEPAMEGEVSAELLSDHRTEYLDAEGTVILSGNRGTVQRWDAGNYTCVDATPEAVEAKLEGARLQCYVRLVSRHEGQWSARFFEKRGPHG